MNQARGLFGDVLAISTVAFAALCILAALYFFWGKKAGWGGKFFMLCILLASLLIIATVARIWIY
ncbi:hypothetical protein [Emcibacter sp. SYSU 3D8]|uniref:hypothetical protein n=1 Tax=Emcibacter sp. SYSU 3D8 TaxID=3133969 RepID=UPI0031FEADE4